MSDWPRTPIDRLLSLDGRTALVTGAADGIGRSVAEAFAAAGSSVALVDRDERCTAVATEIGAAADSDTDAGTLGIVADVSDEGDVVSAFDHTIAEFGRLDIVVNSAGIYPVVPFDELTVETWDTVNAVNLRGIYLCVREAGRRMTELGDGGSIVNISSIGSLNPTPPHAAYGAAKAGVNHLTRTAALHLSQHRIRVNAVLPGVIATEHARESADLVTPDGAARAVRSIPLGRLGETDDIAHACLFLASEASSFVTGQLLAVDGGQLLR